MCNSDVMYDVIPCHVIVVGCFSIFVCTLAIMELAVGNLPCNGGPWQFARAKFRPLQLYF